MRLSTEEHWHHYECFNPACSTCGLSGCVMALRLPVSFDVPVVACPVCGKSMRHDYTTPATESGHLATYDDLQSAGLRIAGAPLKLDDDVQTMKGTREELEAVQLQRDQQQAALIARATESNE